MVFNSFFNFIFSFFQNEPEETKENKLENFYYLSLIREQDGSFSIHGLWPQTTTDNYPEYCKKVIFDINQLTPIMSALQKFWYSEEEKNEEFWKHEWEKHGSCVWTPMNEYDYFIKALKLYHTAIENKLELKYYNSKTGKCLIPIDQNLEFIHS
jgi:ribonuclease I